MNNKNGILIGIFIGIIGIILFISFIIYQDKKVKHDLELKKQQQELELKKEIEEKLDEIEVKPILEGNQENDTTLLMEEDKEKNNKKTTQDILKEESVSMLTFTNVKQCDNLIYLKQSCKNKFLYSLAIENKNINYCNTLTNDIEKNNCKDDINYNKNNCNEIINSFLKEKCQYNLNQQKELAKKEEILMNNNDVNNCKILSNIDKEMCFKNIILKNYNINLCNEISSDKNEQDKCIENISYELNRKIIQEAYTKKDLSLCDKLTTIELKNQCKNMTF